MDIEAWLQGLGLERYVPAFRENEIDAEVLLELSEADLATLGLPLGPRRKLLKAIAGLRQGALPSPAPVSATAQEAERRQLTVMFCDLAGSTALSTRLDPEDLREVIGRYHACVAETVRRCDGFVAKYMGDGVLVYFGYPQAHEDDAEQAVRAGLALVNAVGELAAPGPLRLRIGIATGLVVVGDLIGAGSAQEQAIVGETPNLAARLQAFAEPNVIVIAESTRRLIGALFELADLGPQSLKGFAEPQRAWRVLSENRTLGRFEALRSGATPLVGREEEIELLLRRWTRAKRGEGQVVLLAGEAGIGKSRLTAALIERVAEEPHTRLRYFCSPQHTDSALYPIIGQIERAAGLAHDDTPGAKLDKLDALLALSSTSPEDAGLLAEMLSLANDGRYPILALPPEQRRARTLAALLAQVEALARQCPVLMMFEDAHWSDPTSLEALGRTIDRIANLRVLVVMTFRPEYAPPWIGQPHVTVLTLNRLAAGEAGTLIDRIAGNHALPAGVRQDIIERTDGVPLFVEEMTKAVLEAGSERTAGDLAGSVPFAALAVPASLHASLTARLDRLGAAKHVAQIGAAIGRNFSHALLAAVAGDPEAEFGTALDRLVAAGLLFRQGVPPHATYLFKHALVQDAAYGTLLRDGRRALHARIADSLERGFAEIAERQPELLARHYAEAGQLEKAARLWGKAGQQSLERSALVEATEQMSRALALIAVLPATTALRRERLRLQVALITPLANVKGYASAETKAAAEQARLLIEQAQALGEAPDDPLLPFAALYGIFVTFYTAFDGDMAGEIARQFLSLAEKQDAVAPRMIAHRIMGMSSLIGGEIATGRAHLDRAIALYDPTAHRTLAARFGMDARVSILCYRSWALWSLGYPEAALADVDRAVEAARDTGQAATLMHALVNCSWPCAWTGNDVAAEGLAREAIALAEETGASFWKGYGAALLGCLLALRGNAAEAVAAITSGIADYRAAGSTLLLPLIFGYLAGAHADLGQFDEARHWIGEALALVESTKEKWADAEIHRVAGEIALGSPAPDTARAESYFNTALAIARRQQAKSWELCTATSYARLMREQARVREAHDLLAPVYAWFTEGLGTKDLKEAKALLDELADAPVLAASIGFLTSSAGAEGGKAPGSIRSPTASTDRNSA
jgi:predicted ATPase/class 3 adenylate cyclase